MCPRQVYRKLVITLLLLTFLSAASYLLAASRGIRVVSKKGEPLYLYKDYHAVVIGVSDYDHWPKLPNAVKDTEEVAGKLRELGFEVKLIANPDSVQLKSTLSEIARRLGAEQNRALILYYAGHGETTTLADGTELGYIIPKDCPLQMLDPFGFDTKAVSMKEIEMLALKVRSKHMLALFDSCFSGSLFTLSRAAPTVISEKSAKPVRQFMTAGGANETVPDRSIFKVCLLQGLNGEADYNQDSYITGSELGLYLQTKVINYTRGAQHPQYGKINNPHLDKGDFIFVLKSAEPDVAKITVPDAPSDADKDRLSKEIERLKQERERLEAEKQLLDKEKQELAYIPKTVKSERVSLRAEPEQPISEDYLKDIIKRYDFFDINWNKYGSFANDLKDNGDGTVTDRATGLMWQKSGSPRAKAWRSAKSYVEGLNFNKFAGYSDWRFPTIEELVSLLLRPSKTNSLHIDSGFDKSQTRCWSSDSIHVNDLRQDYVIKAAPYHFRWIVDFRSGNVKKALFCIPDCDSFYARMVNFPSNYVRAVRSAQ